MDPVQNYSLHYAASLRAHTIFHFGYAPIIIMLLVVVALMHSESQCREAAVLQETREFRHLQHARLTFGGVTRADASKAMGPAFKVHGRLREEIQVSATPSISDVNAEALERRIVMLAARRNQHPHSPVTDRRSTERISHGAPVPLPGARPPPARPSADIGLLRGALAQVRSLARETPTPTLPPIKRHAATRCDEPPAVRSTHPRTHRRAAQQSSTPPSVGHHPVAAESSVKIDVAAHERRICELRVTVQSERLEEKSARAVEEATAIARSQQARLQRKAHWKSIKDDEAALRIEASSRERKRVADLRTYVRVRRRTERHMMADHTTLIAAIQSPMLDLRSPLSVELESWQAERDGLDALVAGQREKATKQQSALMSASAQIQQQVLEDRNARRQRLEELIAAREQFVRQQHVEVERQRREFRRWRRQAVVDAARQLASERRRTAEREKTFLAAQREAELSAARVNTLVSCLDERTSPVRLALQFRAITFCGPKVGRPKLVHETPTTALRLLLLCHSEPSHAPALALCASMKTCPPSVTHLLACADPDIEAPPTPALDQLLQCWQLAADPPAEPAALALVASLGGHCGIVELHRCCSHGEWPALATLVTAWHESTCPQCPGEPAAVVSRPARHRVRAPTPSPWSCAPVALRCHRTVADVAYSNDVSRIRRVACDSASEAKRSAALRLGELLEGSVIGPPKGFDASKTAARLSRPSLLKRMQTAFGAETTLVIADTDALGDDTPRKVAGCSPRLFSFPPKRLLEAGAVAASEQSRNPKRSAASPLTAAEQQHAARFYSTPMQQRQAEEEALHRDAVSRDLCGIRTPHALSPAAACNLSERLATPKPAGPEKLWWEESLPRPQRPCTKETLTRLVNGALTAHCDEMRRLDEKYNAK